MTATVKKIIVSVTSVAIATALTIVTMFLYKSYTNKTKSSVNTDLQAKTSTKSNNPTNVITNSEQLNSFKLDDNKSSETVFLSNKMLKEILKKRKDKTSNSKPNKDNILDSKQGSKKSAKKKKKGKSNLNGGISVSNPYACLEEEFE